MGWIEPSPVSVKNLESGKTVNELKITSPTQRLRSKYYDLQEETQLRSRRHWDQLHKPNGKHNKSSQTDEILADKPPQGQPKYSYLKETAVYETNEGSLKAMKHERRRHARRERCEGENQEKRSFRPEAFEITEPVYMPRSKYYSNQEKEGQSSIRSHRRHNKASIPEDGGSIYVGAKTPRQVIKCLKPNEFCIYYQLPDEHASIPYKLRLFLAYMSQNKEVFHFPIVCSKNARTGEDVWSLRYTDSATFPTLQALIKYHKIYSYMDPNTGKIDTFPVWKGVIINDDSYNE